MATIIARITLDNNNTGVIEYQIDGTVTCTDESTGARDVLFEGRTLPDAIAAYSDICAAYNTGSEWNFEDLFA